MESAKRAILAQATIDFGQIAAGATDEETMTVPQAKEGSVVSVSAPDLEAGLVATGFVSKESEVTIRVANVTGGAVNPAEQTFYVAVTY